MEDLLQQLNPQQRAAVEYIEGPELVIAGAGSGKTRVLTYKIAYLIQKGFDPRRLLALTFTNKAANEMRERIRAMLGEKGASRLWMGTFHSIFARILRINAQRIGFRSDFTIYDASDSKSLIKNIIKLMDLKDTYRPSVVQNEISWAKNAQLSPEQYERDRDLMEKDRKAGTPRIWEIYKNYQARLAQANAMDFDDLLYYTNILLRDNPDIRQHYQEYFQYVLVDEYQDTNFSQHLIITQLVGEDGKLCVVGDDAQSIYSFRGANIKNILTLERTFPNLKMFKLEQNYRSTQNILNAANSLIAHNQQQIPKKIFSTKESGDLIEVTRCFSEYEEAATIASRLSQLKMETHDSYNDFALLYRTNAQSRVLEEALRRRNIPYRIYGGLSFYQRKEIKDVVCYFRLIVNPDDDEALRRIINYPLRKIGETTVNKISACAVEHKVSMWKVINDPVKYGLNVNKGTIGKINDFIELIKGFVRRNELNNDAFYMANLVINTTGILNEFKTDKTPENISKMENIHELINATSTFVEQAKEEGSFDNVSLLDFLQEASLATDVESESDGDNVTERVNLMTVHAAKGLEFTNVFIVGVEEGLFPSYMSTYEPRGVEEERRLMYVAITRAKRFCLVSYAQQRTRNGATEPAAPSRFIQEISSDYIKSPRSYRKGSSSNQLSSNYGNSYASWSRTSDNPMSSYKAGAKSEKKNTNSSFNQWLDKMANASKTSSESSSQSSSTSNLSQSTRHRTTVVSGLSSTSNPSASKVPITGGKGTPSLHTADELSVGMKIRHTRFGYGTITEISTLGLDPKINVSFDTEGDKVLLLKFAQFSIED